MSITNSVRKALLERTQTVGAWIQIDACPTLAEIFAHADYDWFGLDCERSDIDVEGFTTLARGTLPLARVRENDTLVIRQMLDVSALDVAIPLVNPIADAYKVVTTVKHLLLDVLDFCFSRINQNLPPLRMLYHDLE